MKRFVLFTILFAATIFNANAYDFSAEAPSGQTLYYNIHGDSAIVTYPGPNGWNSYYGFTAPTGNLIIPEDVIFNEVTYPVTSIGSYAFYGCSGLTSISIPDGVISIGQYAFYGCSGLTSISIPDGVISIGQYAFCGCSGLTSISIPDGVISIGQDAFSGCGGLTSVTIGNGVTSIGDYAFYYCIGLTSVTIPSSVTSIGDYAFYYCIGLTSVTIPSSVTSIGYDAFHSVRHIEYYGTASGSPWSAVSMNGVTEEYFAFSDTTKHFLTAFFGSGGDVTIPSSVDTIGESAFVGCNGLTSVTIPNGVISIGANAFYNCSGLTSVIMSNSVISIGNYAFQNCSGLTSVTIPNSVTSIGNYAFYNCSGLTSVTIPNSVTSIGNYAFYNCSGLTSVTIPNSVTAINACTFFGCTGLTSVTIGKSVTNIYIAAFSGCINLTEIVSLAEMAPVLEIPTISGLQPPFFNVPSSANVTIPCGSAMSYYSRWSYFSNFIEDEGFSFSVQSGDNTMGQVNILTTPTCQAPTAVFNTVANSGYRFDHWSDGNTDNPRYLTLSSDTSIIAMFVSTHSVNVSNALGGGEYIHGSTATLAALPQAGLQFDGWSDGETMNPRNIVVTSDTTLTAVYSAPDTVHVYDTTTIYDTVINIVYDTTEYNHYYYDTTRIYDTLVVFDTTWTIDTLVVYDTTRVFDTMVFVNIDTVNHYYFDTTRVFDTLVSLDTIHHYYFDTTRVFDTMVFVNIDTVNHFYFDTTRIFDTIVFVNVDTVNHYYFDTTRFFDTLVSLDTIHHYYFDTTRVFDTMVFVNIDTVNHYYFDTTRTVDTLVFYDTTSVTHYVFDSTWVFDSVWIFDSVYIFDTIYIHDTIVVGVDDVETINAKIYIHNGQIVVEGAEGNQVWLYDAVGRMIATKQEDSAPIRFNVSASGTYLVKVGNHPARRVVVIR